MTRTGSLENSCGSIIEYDDGEPLCGNGRKRGEDEGDRLLWRCCSIGTSIKSEASSRFEGFWNIQTNSSRRLDRDCSEADCASLFTCLVEGAIV